jgi:hypothetical protein
MKYLDNDDEDEKCYSLKTHMKSNKKLTYKPYMDEEIESKELDQGLFYKQIYNQEHDEKDIQMMIYFVR